MPGSEAPEFGLPTWATAPSQTRSTASMSASAAPLRLFLTLLLALAPALASRADGADRAAIVGTVDVSVTSPALKHWGIPDARAAFLPDADRSAYARRVRAAVDAHALCDALAQASGRDPAMAMARVDGDGNLEHRAGDVMRLEFRIEVARLTAAARGIVYLCSSPILAVVGRGSYPDERFERVEGHRFRWVSRPLTLDPGEEARVVDAASVDASGW